MNPLEVQIIPQLRYQRLRMYVSCREAQENH